MEIGIKRGREGGGEYPGVPPTLPALGAESRPRRQPWKKQQDSRRGGQGEDRLSGRKGRGKGESSWLELDKQMERIP